MRSEYQCCKNLKYRIQRNFGFGLKANVAIDLKHGVSCIEWLSDCQIVLLYGRGKGCRVGRVVRVGRMNEYEREISAMKSGSTEPFALMMLGAAWTRECIILSFFLVFTSYWSSIKQCSE